MLDKCGLLHQLAAMAIDLEALLSDARKAIFFRDFEQALGLLNRAGAMAIEGDAGDEIVAPILRAIGDARCGLNDWEGGETYYREALARMEALGVGESSEAAGLLCNLGYLLDKQERYEESEEAYHRALVTRTRALGKDHPDLVPILNNMAYRFMNLGDLQRAQGLLERALVIVEAVVEPDHLALAEPLNNLGELYRRQGNTAGAVPLLQRALSIMEAKVPEEDHPDLLVFLRNTAAALRDDGRDEEARALDERAERISGG